MKDDKKMYGILALVVFAVFAVLVIWFINKNIVSPYNNIYGNFVQDENIQKSSPDAVDNEGDVSKLEDDTYEPIVNNGSDFVRIGNCTYYREYKKDSFADDTLVVDVYNPGPNYEYKGNHPKKMMKINENGEKEELFEDKGVGKIFVLGDRMYLREIDFDSENQGTGVSRLYSVDFSGQNRKDYGTGEFNYADEKSNKIIYSTYDNIVVINNMGEEEFKIPDGRFLLCDKQDCIIYYEKYHENRDNPDDKRGALQLWAINIDGSNNKMLNAVTPEYEYRSSWHEMEEIANLQIKDDYIYISYGYYAGTGHFYTGKIARMKKDGTSLDILTESDVKDFFILEKDGVDYLIFSATTIASPEESNCSMNLNNKEISPTKDFLPCSLDEPFEEQSDNNPGDDKNNKEYAVNYSIYTDNHGNKLQLISKNDFKETLGNLYEDRDDDGDNGRYRKVAKVEYTGDCVYFSIEEGERNKEKDVGWRYAYKRIKTEVYQKNLKTSKITMINSY